MQVTLWKQPQTDDLEKGREARIARQRLERQDEYVSHLRRAAIVWEDTGEPLDPRLLDLIQQSQSHQRRLLERSGERIFPRKRPKRRNPTPADSCLVFLDECGSHSLTAAEPFPMFCLSVVIVREAAWEDLDLKWRTWKATYLGSAAAIVHEPDVRRGEWPFGSPDRHKLLESLRQQIGDLEYSVIVCVLRRDAYKASYGTAPLDESLPADPYLMSLDFMFERVVMALDTQFNGGRARLIAESRGPTEDALLQYEFARLHLHGTSYIAAAWFRQQLHPGITFQGKGQSYATGLELADLVARPCGEKVAEPDSTPDRWPEFRTKLCHGRGTKNSILGLKIVPWDDIYADLWKS